MQTTVAADGAFTSVKNLAFVLVENMANIKLWIKVLERQAYDAFHFL